MKIKLLIIFIVVMIIATLTMSYTAMIIYPAGSEENVSFKTGTFAVCSERNGYVYCEDRVFASCNGTLIEATGETVECGGKSYTVGSSPLAGAYMHGNWADPRPADFITGWAAAK